MAWLVRPFITGSYEFRVGFSGLTTQCWYYVLTTVSFSYLVTLPFSFTIYIGAGCIWNDILDRELDRQVGKGCTRSK